MDDPHVMAVCDDADDDADERRRVALAVAPLLHDGVKELAAVAHVHGEADIALVLVHAADAHHVGVPRQVVHDLHLAPHVVDLLGAAQLALGNDLSNGEWGDRGMGRVLGDDLSGGGRGGKGEGKGAWRWPT